MSKKRLFKILGLITILILLGGCSPKEQPQPPTLTPPIAPSNLAAEVLSPTEVKLTWQDNSDNEEGFKVERKTEGEDWSEIVTVEKNVTTFTDKGLSSNITYYYRVRAYNSAGEGAYSNETEINIYVSYPQVTDEIIFDLQGFATLGGGTTGGEGGEVVYVDTGNELQNEINKGGPRTIYVNGKITPENSQGLNEIFVNKPNISIIGVETSGELEGIGIKIIANNIIIRNLKIHHVLLGNKDCITIEGPSRNIWIDHCELFNQLEGVDQDYYDGLLDIKGAVDYVTVSWCYFHDSWKTSLIGSSDTDNYHRTITYHHNLFEHCNSRVPSFRSGEGHMFNNCYIDIQSSGINSRMGAKLRIEYNYFERVRKPICSLYSPQIGYWHMLENIFNNCSEIPSSSTCVYNPPYTYYVNPVDKVKEIVTQYAGVGKINP